MNACNTNLIRVGNMGRQVKVYVDRHCVDCGVKIHRVSRARCVPCAYTAMRRPIPDDLADVLRLHGSLGAAKHYRTSLASITKWRRAIGIRAQERVKIERARIRLQGFVPGRLMIHRDFSLVGQAADYLRRWGAVYRCHADGAPNAKGKFWRRGLSVIDDDRLMLIAGKLGWKPVEM